MTAPVAYVLVDRDGVRHSPLEITLDNLRYNERDSDFEFFVFLPCLGMLRRVRILRGANNITCLQCLAEEPT